MAAPSGTIISYPDNYRAYKALIAAEYSGAKVQVGSNFVMGETNKTPAFLEKFPLGKVPVFEGSNGDNVWESSAIAYYLANDQLRGGVSALDRAHVIQWISFSDCEIGPAAGTWLYPILGYMPYDKKATERAQDDIKRVMGMLDKVLLAQTFLVGERITLADISVACSLALLYKHVMDPKFRAPFVNVNRWYQTLVHQAEFKAATKGHSGGDAFPMCDKMEEFSQKKFQEVQAKMKGGASPADKKDKKKKEKKSSESGDAGTAVDPTEEVLAAEPKDKDPFATMPKGSFNMDEFKRCYSNEETNKSIPFFWEKFDPENYSIWYAEYKYPEELTQVFMSCNLIAGMFQRLDKMRKNAFGSMCLFGENNNSSISGIWVWRGHELAFTLSPDWQVDYDSYSWTKLDAKDEETKKLVQQYFNWEGKDKQGRGFNQGKIFNREDDGRRMSSHYIYRRIRGRSFFLVLGFFLLVVLVGQFLLFFGAPVISSFLHESRQAGIAPEELLSRMQGIQAQLAELKSEESTIQRVLKLACNRQGDSTAQDSFEGQESNSDKQQLPSLKSEVARRRVETDVDELWYFLSSVLKKSEGSETGPMLSKTKDRYLSLKRDLAILKNQTGEGNWREREMAELAELVQTRIAALQNPEDCGTARKLVCHLTKACGFGCQVHHLAYCLIVAYATDRTLILKSQG
ncbi:unnamed protein product [Cyprideis torosa]|uniref:Elongation factor 1-gamma n=1 Tax=Cyprideis torosa TaxID=163714 RepID=A0A7R8WPV2_9CRUS|nr:unnamed protein product [Cyprideis torosa]CAG0901767.1 unnamed protein product [Cyprideis torosa]